MEGSGMVFQPGDSGYERAAAITNRSGDVYRTRPMNMTDAFRARIRSKNMRPDTGPSRAGMREAGRLAEASENERRYQFEMDKLRNQQMFDATKFNAEQRELNERARLDRDAATARTEAERTFKAGESAKERTFQQEMEDTKNANAINMQELAARLDRAKGKTAWRDNPLVGKESAGVFVDTKGRPSNPETGINVYAYRLLQSAGLSEGLGMGDRQTFKKTVSPATLKTIAQQYSGFVDTYGKNLPAGMAYDFAVDFEDSVKDLEKRGMLNDENLLKVFNAAIKKNFRG
jgi:hypothetical protein